jgi:hypothetical protein
MSEFEDIQRLIRLKKHEKPPADIADQIIAGLHERVRAEALRQSARGLFWERVKMMFSESLMPRMALAAAVIAALALAVSLLMPSKGAQTTVAGAKETQQVQPVVSNSQPEAVKNTAPFSEDGPKMSTSFSVAGVRIIALDEPAEYDPGYLGNHFNGEPHEVLVFDSTGRGRILPVMINALPEEEEAKEKDKKLPN